MTIRVGDSITITGTAEVMRILESIAPKDAANLLRSTTDGIAAEVRKEVKKRIIATTKKRTGKLRKSIKSRRRRSPRTAPVSIVYMAKGSGYWRPLEYGTKHISPRRFLRDGAAVVRSNLDATIAKVFTKKLESKIKSSLKRAGKL